MAGEDSRPYSLVTDEDGTRLFLEIDAGAGGDEGVVARIREEIESFGLAVPVDEKALQSALEESSAGRDARVVVASGRPCRHGEDGKVLWAKKLVSPTRADGSFSHYLGTLEKKIVRKDDPVARFVPETEGTDGSDVYGKPVKARRGKPVKMRVGPGLRESDGVVFAEKDGMIRVENSLMKLDETFVVEGDLDFETGNVNFPGSVIVTGSVLDLFEIKAGGSIQIKGLVEAATLSARGDIEIAGGLAGKNKGRVMTEGSVAAQFLVNAYVFAEGDVCVESEILSSQVTALGAVKAAGCSIAGGKVEALGGIATATLGSDIGARTQVSAGVCDTLPQLIQANAARIEEARKRLLNLKRSLVSGGESAGSRLKLARKEIRAIQAQLCSCLVQRKRLALAWQSARPVIVVTRMIYPGVSVTVGPYTLQIDEEITGPVKLKPDRKNRRVKILAKD